MLGSARYPFTLPSSAISHYSCQHAQHCLRRNTKGENSDSAVLEINTPGMHLLHKLVRFRKRKMFSVEKNKKNKGIFTTIYSWFLTTCHRKQLVFCGHNRHSILFFQQTNCTTVILILFLVTMPIFMVKVHVVCDLQQFPYPTYPFLSSRWQITLLYRVLNFEPLLCFHFLLNLHNFWQAHTHRYQVPNKQIKSIFCRFITLLSFFSYPTPLILPFLSGAFNFKP